MKIYLASPFFSCEELTVYKAVINDLRAVGYEVYVPQENEIEDAWSLSNDVWAKAVYDEDIKAIKESDVVMVLNFGMYSDSGTAWEAGFAYAIKKEVVHVLCGKENATYSLMMINGCDKVVSLCNVANWEEVSAAVPFEKIIQK
jgi:nucleoside 2-deoxyribosyltransferase